MLHASMENKQYSSTLKTETSYAKEIKETLHVLIKTLGVSDKAE
jgi:hypothetical protein